MTPHKPEGPRRPHSPDGAIKIPKRTVAHAESMGLIPSLLSVGFLIVMLSSTVLLFGVDSTQGPAQVSLTLSGFFAAMVALTRGAKWLDLEVGIMKSIGDATKAVLILLLIGALIGVWILAGVVPSIIVWGLTILRPFHGLITGGGDLRLPPFRLHEPDHTPYFGPLRLHGPHHHTRPHHG